MNLAEFREALDANPDNRVRFAIDDQHAVADHFHVTEVGRVEKQFVDCGGVRRCAVTCVLQTLVAHDVDHRLTTTKLAKIVALADSLDLAGDTPVEVEHQERSVSIDAISDFEVVDGAVVFRLAAKQTACLAEDACGLGLAPDGTVLNVLGDACGGTGCC